MQKKKKPTGYSNRLLFKYLKLGDEEKDEMQGALGISNRSNLPVVRI